MEVDIEFANGDEVDGEDWNRKLAVIIFIAAVFVADDVQDDAFEVTVVVVFRHDISTSSTVIVIVCKDVSYTLFIWFNLYSTVVLRGWITLSFL